jgi:membrane-anchored protein YejM (alkaline phosphatase superfamily)
MLIALRKPLLLFFLGGLFISSLYAVVFGYDSAAIPLHTVMVSLYSLCTLLCCSVLLAAARQHIAARMATFVIWLVFLFILSSVYISSFLSSYFWSEPMYDKLLINSFSLLLEFYSAYFSHIVEVAGLLLHRSTQFENIGLMVYSLTIGFLLFPFALLLLVWLARKITRYLSRIQFQSTGLARIMALCLLCMILCASMQYACLSLYAAYNWRGEVLIDTFFSKSYLPYTEPYRAHLAEQDRETFNQMPVTQGNGQNIILIIVDALRGNYVYDKNFPPPFISQLIAEHKLQTENLVYSTCSYSLCGITGIVASKDVVELNPDNVKVQEVFKKDGYRTYSISAGFPDWYGMKAIYQKTYDTYIDSDISPHETHLDDLITDNLPIFPLEKTQPFFVYLRLMSTHEYGRLKPAFMNISRYEYANRVLQADDYLKQIFAILEKKGVLHNTTILITGDHGDSQGEKHEYGHNVSLYHNQLHIPILIYDEHQTYPKATLASSLDIAPTLVDRAGLAVPAFWNGLSLLKNDHGDRLLFHSKAGARYQTDRMRAVTYLHDGKVYKYIYTGAKKFSVSPHKEELFEITSDPEEDHNLITSIDPVILATMKDAYQQHFRD